MTTHCDNKRTGNPKRCFSSRVQAYAFAEKQCPRLGYMMSAYYCSNCDSWHVGGLGEPVQVKVNTIGRYSTDTAPNYPM